MEDAETRTAASGNVLQPTAGTRRWLIVGWHSLACGILLVWLYGQIVRDRSVYEAVAFYLPSPVAGACLVLSAALAFRLRRRRLAVAYLALAGLPVIFVILVENQWSTPRRDAIPVPRPQRLRLVHWNVAHGGSRWERQKQRLLAQDADVIVISEPPLDAAAADFPEYRLCRLPKMLVAVKGRTQPSGSLVPGGALHAFLIECDLEHGPLRLMIADMTSRVLVPRDPYLRNLMTVSTAERADLIVGDLNAPRRSRAFTDDRFPFRHAYHTSGAGWGYTWPVPVPVLAIDQCLIGGRVEPLMYRLVSTRDSDHRLQCFDFRLKEFAARGDNSDAATSE